MPTFDFLHNFFTLGSLVSTGDFVFNLAPGK